MNGQRFLLRDLPFSTRLTLAVFLATVGVGYFAALVQLHVQYAGAGQILPGSAEVVRLYHGSSGDAKSPLQRLLEADESLPFNGQGTMAPAFTTRSDGWRKAIGGEGRRGAPDPKLEPKLREERNAERLTILAWVKAGTPQEPYDTDRWPITDEIRGITAEYRDGDAVKLKTLLCDRCTRCHMPGGADAKAKSFPLETFGQFERYAKVDNAAGRMGVEKLAQSTHAHLLSFAMLFAFTGGLFSLTSYPGILRLVLSPLVLFAQLAEISCWWLARIPGHTGEQFALAIPLLGAVVGGGLVAQIVLTLLHLFGRMGRGLVIAVLLAVAFAGYVAKTKWLGPYLNSWAEPVKAD